MIVRRSNIKKEDDASVLTGRLAEVLFDGGGFSIGNIVLIKSIENRNGNGGTIQVISGNGQDERTGHYNYSQLYLLPSTSEEFDKEIEETQKTLHELEDRKNFLKETNASEFNENDYKLYGTEKEILEAEGNPEKIRDILKKMSGFK